MNFFIKIALDMLVKVIGPFNGAKTIIGFAIAVISYVAPALGVDIPALDPKLVEWIGYLIASFGLGDKFRKYQGGQGGGKAI